MSKKDNNVLMSRVIEALFAVAGRRTLDSFAVQIIKTVIKKLEPTYPFLHDVQIQDTYFSEGKIKVNTDESIINAVKADSFGKALDAIIRVVYMQLVETTGDDVGLFFTTELKEHLGDENADELRKYGVDFGQMQLEQHLRYQTKETISVRAPKKIENENVEEEEKEIPYSWETVSAWKYDNNVCLLYNSQGTLLDTLQLDLLIEDYVRRVVEEKEETTQPQRTLLTVTEKDDELLEMLRRTDMDTNSALTLLHISQQKLDAMIHKLIELDMLQYISPNEVKLTEKGLSHLSENKRSK